ncbi:hypothetical protein [Sphingosinicella sp.]|uniref:hypothetical protein n=1 Tax=Sphingosinicella sp. TaxID=1917971 RepID=UPI00403817AF
MAHHEHALRAIGGWRIAGWSLAALILLLPLVAMRFTDEVNWTGSDFVFAGVMIGSVGLVFELAVRRSRNIAYRAGVAFALAAAFLVVWANGAVGMIGNEDNLYNLLFGAVLLVALLGSAVARCRPAGMALALAAAGLVQIGVALGGLGADPRGAVFSIVLAGPWLLAAALFRAAAKDAAR